MEPKKKSTLVADHNKVPTKNIFRVDNNFETYHTMEEPSQDYMIEYMIHCIRNHKMKIGEIKFIVVPIAINMRNVPVGKYK